MVLPQHSAPLTPSLSLKGEGSGRAGSAPAGRSSIARVGRGLRRGGHLTLELLFVFPILFVLLLAMVQFSLTLHARQQLLAASREGARVAAVGGDLPAVRERVKQCLGTGRLAEAEVAATNERGEPLPENLPLPSGELVLVWVKVPTGYVVPDLLRFIGYSHRDEELVGRTAMRKE